MTRLPSQFVEQPPDPPKRSSIYRWSPLIIGGAGVMATALGVLAWALTPHAP